MPAVRLRGVPFFVCLAAIGIACATPAPTIGPPVATQIVRTETPIAPTPVVATAVTTSQGPSAPARVVAHWIVHENVADASRWLLVAGSLPKGTEDDPPPDAEYMVLKGVDESFARSSGLPVRTLTIPRFYTLPDPFEVSATIDTEPPGARVYEVVAGGALVPLGIAPVVVSVAGSVSDLKVSIAGTTSLVRDIPAGGLPLDLWAATDTKASARDAVATPVPMLTDADLSTLRAPNDKHAGRVLHKHFTLPVQTPLSQAGQTAIAHAIVIIVKP